MIYKLLRLKAYCKFNLLFLFRNFIFIFIFIAGYSLSLNKCYWLLNGSLPTNWIIMNVEKALDFPKIIIFYYPDIPIVKNLLNSVRVNKTIRPMVNVSLKMDSLFNNYMSPYIYAYQISAIRLKPYSNFLSQNPKDISNMNVSLTLNDNHPILAGKFQSNFFNAVYLLYSSFDISKQTIFIGGLPDFFDRPLSWPGMYLMFVFGIMGCFIVNYNQLNSAYQYPVMDYTGIYLKLLSLFIVYNIVGALAHSSFIPLMTCMNGNNILTKWSPLFVSLIFTVVFNTGLFAVSVVAVFNADVYNTLFGMGVIIVPQILYLYAHGNIAGASTMAYHVSLISPVFSMGWLLALLEAFESYVYNDLEYFVYVYSTAIRTSFIILISANICTWVMSCLIIVSLNYFEWLLVFERLKGSMIIQSENPIHNSFPNTSSPITSCNIDIVNNYLNYTQPTKLNSNNSIRKSEKRIQLSKPVSNYLKRYFKINSGLKSSEIQTVGTYCIIVKHLYKFFNDELTRMCALNNLNIAARKNSITAIVGPNGSGKSILIQILSGKMRATRGSIIINNIDITSTNKHGMFSKIATFTNNWVKFEFLTALEYLHLVLSMSDIENAHPVTTSTIKTLALILDLDDCLNIKLGICPLFVIRLVQIMSVFLIDTPIVLLDEPYVDLDYRSQQRINCLLQNRKTRQSIIVTTSRAIHIEMCADKVILIFNGKSVLSSNVCQLRIKNRLGFRLLCFLGAKSDERVTIEFVESTYPDIKFELYGNRIIQFLVPNILTKQLSRIRNDLLSNANQCGIKQVTLNQLNIQSNSHQIFHNIEANLVPPDSDCTNKNSLVFIFKHSWLNETFCDIYFNQFLLLFRNRILVMLRFPSRCALSMIMPIVMVLLTVTMTISFKPWFLYYDRYPDFVDEVMIGFSDNISFYSAFIKVLFSDNQKPVVKYMKCSSRNQFTAHLLQSATNNSLNYKLNVKVAMLFLRSTEVGKIVILSNFENIIAKVFERLLNYATDVDIKFLAVEKIEKPSTYSIEKNFMLGLIFIANVLFINRLFHKRNSHKFEEKNKFLKFVLVHYSICFLPEYCLDILRAFIINGYFVLIIYSFVALEIIVPDENVYFLIIILAIYIFCDITLKTLVCKQFDSSPSVILFFLYFDFLMLFVSSDITEKVYKMYLKNNGYPFLHQCLSMKNRVFIAMIFLSPSFNLCNGFISYLENPSWGNSCDDQLLSRKLSGSNSSFSIAFVVLVLSVQLIVFMVFLFVVNHPKIIWFSHSSAFSRLRRIKTLTSLENVDCESQMSPPIMSFNKVSYSSRINRDEFHEINWDVLRGTISMILGPSSSGKTLLVELVVGLRKPSSGYVSYNIYGSMGQVKISYCKQNPVLFEELTVTELFDLWNNIQCLATREKTWEKTLIMKELHLFKYSNRLIRHLSDLIIKKICIGLSVIGFPSLIVLDDPLANLDTMSQLNVLSLLNLAKSRHSTIIITGTELNNLYGIIDNILILKDHQVIYQGKWKNIPSDVYVGYYLTFVFKEQMKNENDVVVTIQKVFEWKFHKASVINQFRNIVIFFIPYEENPEIDYSTIVIFIEEELKPNFNIIQYLINFNIYM